MLAEELIGSQITAKGTIRTITFKPQGFESGDFAIFKLECSEIEGNIPEDFITPKYSFGHLLTFTGRAPSLNQRITYEIIGELVYNDRYGYQYKIIRMTEEISFETDEDIFKFFSYVLTESTAQKIMDTIEDPVSVLENGDVKRLTAIPGVGIFRAQKIIEKYKEARLDSKAYVALYNYGLTKEMIARLCDAYRSPETLINKIQSNPYILIYEVRGIGWNKADAIAMAAGIQGSDPRRIRAYIYYILIADGETGGNTRADVDELIEVVEEAFGESAHNDILAAIAELVEDGRLYFEPASRLIGLMDNRIMEERIAAELLRIYKAESIEIRNAQEIIKRCEKDEGFEYSDEQKRAIYSCINSNVSIVTGFPGAGKTTVMYPVSQIMAQNNCYVSLCALSGKASVNLEEATRLHGRTIHRLLGYKEGGSFEYSKINPLPCDMVILDEASMVDESIFLHLLEAIPDGCKLVLLGDVGQLDPIGLGCVFHDIIQTRIFPHTNFTKIFRQAQKSGIITESRRVHDGEYIVGAHDHKVEVRGELQDFKIVTTESIDECVSETILEYQRFMNDYNATVDDIIVVMGKRNNGACSARAINNYIQKLVNGTPSHDEIQLTKKDGNTSYSIIFRPGDKVLITKNCYDTLDLNGNPCPVFNGNLGTILKISRSGMEISFRQGVIWYPSEKFFELELGYAITCHKSQGSGFPYVITVCDTGSYILLSKEWLYTAITRAKKYNTLIGQPSAIRRACSVTGVKFKSTWLKDLILDSFENAGTNT